MALIRESKNKMNEIIKRVDNLWKEWWKWVGQCGNELEIGKTGSNLKKNKKKKKYWKESEIWKKVKKREKREEDDFVENEDCLYWKFFVDSRHTLFEQYVAWWVKKCEQQPKKIKP